MGHQGEIVRERDRSVFDATPLRGPEGGVDFERFARHVDSRLHLIPRYRQKLAYVPLEGRAVWVDDKSFNLHYHLRHTSLPKPGDEHQLKRLCARIMSQALDLGKPLWEMWIIEGLGGDRMAMISKVHHCMIDGISGVDLLTVLMSPTAEPPRTRTRRPGPRGRSPAPRFCCETNSLNASRPRRTHSRVCYGTRTPSSRTSATE